MKNIFFNPILPSTPSTPIIPIKNYIPNNPTPSSDFRAYCQGWIVLIIIIIIIGDEEGIMEIEQMEMEVLEVLGERECMGFKFRGVYIRRLLDWISTVGT